MTSSSTWFQLTGTLAGVTTEKLDFGAFGGQADWGFEVNNGTFYSSGTARVADTTAFIVGSVNLTNGTVDIYGDPTSTAMPALPSATTTISGVTATSTLAFGHLQAYVGTSTNTVYLGGITFGNSYSDVVPEPSTLAMCLLPGAMILTRRRRRRISDASLVE